MKPTRGVTTCLLFCQNGLFWHIPDELGGLPLCFRFMSSQPWFNTEAREARSTERHEHLSTCTRLAVLLDMHLQLVVKHVASKEHITERRCVIFLSGLVPTISKLCEWRMKGIWMILSSSIRMRPSSLNHWCKTLPYTQPFFSALSKHANTHTWKLKYCSLPVEKIFGFVLFSLASLLVFVESTSNKCIAISS